MTDIIRTVGELEAANKAQAEKIKRLQAALREADKDSFWASSDRYVDVKPLMRSLTGKITTSSPEIWRAPMSDIIARAKQVLKGGDWDGSLALESVHAISEETYVYTAQVHMYNRSWAFMWSPTSGNSVRGKWHATRELAEKFAEQWQLDYPVRLVRRRVSPVEVIG